MKIITVNLPQSYINMIEGLIGEQGLYPSRSELIRVAVRDFLIRELKYMQNMNTQQLVENMDFQALLKPPRQEFLEKEQAKQQKRDEFHERNEILKKAFEQQNEMNDTNTLVAKYIQQTGNLPRPLPDNNITHRRRLDDDNVIKSDYCYD